MNGSSPNFAIHRILLALDASPASLAALQAAAELAARMNAELRGLFVEDAALLGLAEIPFAREVLYFSTEGAPLSRENLERRLRAQSEHVRSMFALATQRARTECSFRSVRGRVTSEISTAAEEVDLLVMGVTGRSIDRPRRVGSTALAIASSSIPVLLLPKRGIPKDVHLVVYFDGSKAAEQGLCVTIELARAGMDGITILVESGNHGQAQLPEDLLTGEPEIEIHRRLVDSSNKEALLAALESEKDGLLVVGGRDLLRKLPPLDEILREIEMPLLLLGPVSESTAAA